MSLSSHINEKANLIWAIADKLTGVYKPHEYGEVILPLTVIRRFDCILSDTKDAVIQKFEEVKELPMRDILLRKASGYQFYNTSKYTFERLLDDPDNIEVNFRDYLNQRVGCFREKIRLCALYYNYLLKDSKILDSIFLYETGTANQVNLGIESIGRTKVHVPPYEERVEIAEYLLVKCNDIDDSINKKQTAINKLIEYKNPSSTRQ